MKKKKIVKIICIFVAAAIIVPAVILNSPRQFSTVADVAMGSPCKVTVYGGKDRTIKCNNAREKIKKLDEEMLSHTIKSSYTYSINENSSFTVSDEYIMYLKNILNLANSVKGYTLLSGNLKDLWKIEDGGYVPTADEIKEILPKISNENIVIEGNNVSIKNGGKLDLGAVGKGTGCQVAIDRLKDDGVKNALCTVGGTVGVVGSPQGKKPFKIGVRNPFGTANDTIGTIKATNCFISTSGNYEKYFIKDDVRYSHIFDSRTGAPVQNNIVSVTVISDNGTISDFLSTAVCILGEHEGMMLCEKFNSKALIIKDDNTIFMTESLKADFDLTNEDFTVL